MKKSIETAKTVLIVALFAIVSLFAVLLNEETREHEELKRSYYNYYNASANYITLLEDDLGEEFVEEVECETDQFQDYYKLLDY